MIQPVHYELTSDDGLTKWTYRYWLDDRSMMLVLDHYKKETRPTKRHKFRAVVDGQMDIAATSLAMKKAFKW